MALFLIVVAAAPVNAQAPERPDMVFDVEAVAAPLLPPALKTIATQLAFSCSLQELLGPPDGEIVVTTNVSDAPAFATYVAAPSEVRLRAVRGDGCTDASPRHYVNGTLTVTLDRRAPAFEPQGLVLTVTARHARVSGETDTWGPLTSNLTYMADYSPVFEANPSSTQLISPGPDVGVVFPILLRHASNGPSVFTVTAATEPDFPALTFDLPGPIEVAAGSATPIEIEANVVARVPAASYHPRTEYVFHVTYHLASKDPRGATTADQNVVLGIRSLESKGRVPLDDGLTFVALAAALAVSARTRRGLT